MSQFDEEARKFEAECLRQVKSVAEEIEAYYDERMYRDEDGDHIELDCDDERTEELDQLTLYDWMDDVLDIYVTCSLDGQLRSCEIVVTTGGPHIEVDTGSKAVKLYWGSTRTEWPISYGAADELDDIVSEMWSCRC